MLDDDYFSADFRRFCRHVFRLRCHLPSVAYATLTPLIFLHTPLATLDADAAIYFLRR